MLATVWFRLMSTIKSIRFNKYMAGFTAFSYTIGLLLPTIILTAAYHEITQLNHSFMNDSERIIRVEDQTQMIPDSELDSSSAISDRELLHQLLSLGNAVEQVFYKSEKLTYLSDNKQYRSTQIVYVNDLFKDNYPNFVKRGNWFQSTEFNECIIGTNLARKLWQGSGINREIRVGGSSCTVIGETDVFDSKVVMRDQEKEDMGGLTQFFVKLKDEQEADAVVSSIHQLGRQYKIDSVQNLNQDQLDQAYEAFMLLLLLSLIVLLYSLLNISNTIGLMLNERRRKYGIQMALGSRRRGLFFEFYFELLMITSFSVILVYFLLYFGEPIIEHYLFLIRINGFILFVLSIFNMGLCVILGMIFTKRILRSNVVQLIRGSDG